MLVTTDVRVSLIENSSGREAASEAKRRAKTERLHSQRPRCLRHNRKVKGIISCFILPELKSSSSTPTATY